MNHFDAQEKEAPFFSIVIASLNNFDYLRSCVDSINAQNFTSYEVLISDGGSTDATHSIIDPFHIRNLSWSKSSPDLGIYYALNSALAEIKGQWVLVLGSDDKLCDPDSLKRAHIAIVQSNNHSNLLYSDLLIRGPQGLRLKKYPDFDKFCTNFSGAPFIHHQTAFVSRNAICEFGSFDTRYRIHADYDLMLRMIIGKPAIKINDTFVEYNSSGYSSRIKNIIKSVNEVREIRRKLGFPEFNLRLGLIYSRLLLRSMINFQFLKNIIIRSAKIT